MAYIALGAAGFLVGALFDWVSLQGGRGLKPALWLVHCALIVYPTVMLSLESDRFSLPLWAVVIGWVGLLASIILLLHALFVNLPLKKTYIASAERRELVVSGAYALVRHPGFMWFGFSLVSLVLVSGSRLLLLALPLWMLLDALWIGFQEKFIFDKLFDGYRAYARETPMLLPNRKSIAAFRASLRHSKGVNKANAGIP